MLTECRSDITTTVDCITKATIDDYIVVSESLLPALNKVNELWSYPRGGY